MYSHRMLKPFGYLIAVVVVGTVLSMTAINAADHLGENGVFELSQALTLGVGVGLWLYRGPAPLSLNVLFASIILVFLGRETSWTRAYGGSEALVDMLEMAHIILLTLTLGILTIIWISRTARDAKLFRTAWRSNYIVWMWLAIILMLTGDIFEKKLFDLNSNLFWEEWCELAGYVSLIIPIFLKKAGTTGK